jgi:hypothetical protein
MAEKIQTPVGEMVVTRHEIEVLHAVASAKCHYLLSGTNMPENEVVTWSLILALTTHWLQCTPKED